MSERNSRFEILTLILTAKGWPDQPLSQACSSLRNWVLPLPRQRLTLPHLHSLTGHRLETPAPALEWTGFLIRFIRQLKAVHMTELKSVYQRCGAKKACPEESSEVEFVTCFLLNSRTAPWSYLHTYVIHSVNLCHEAWLVRTRTYHSLPSRLLRVGRVSVATRRFVQVRLYRDS
jgi:hypothetical protein